MANLDASLSESLTNLQYFEFRFYKILTAFCENSKVVFFSVFLMMKSISTSSFLSSLPIKLTCCIENNYNPWTNSFLFLAEFLLFSTRAFSKLH